MELDVHYREWPRSHFKPNHAWVIMRRAYGSPPRPRSGRDLYERSSSRACARFGGPAAGGIQFELSKRTDLIA